VRWISGDWGLGIGDWGLGQSPIPHPPYPKNLIKYKFKKNSYFNFNFLKLFMLRIKF